MFTETVDTDIWWHIGIGKDIIETASVPHVNRYSLLGHGEPYHDSYWLFQIIVAAIDRKAGIPGVQLFVMALWGIVLSLTYRTARAWIEPRSALLLLFVAAFASSVRFVPRPEVVSYLMVILFYFLLQERRYAKPRHLALFFVLQVIWTNGHSLFVFGPFLSGCYLAAAALSRPGPERSPLAHLMRLTVLLLLATLVGPYGAGGWKHAYLLFTQVAPDGPALYKTIAEFMPSFSPQIRETPVVWVFGVQLALFAVTTAAALRTGSLPLHRLFICLFFAAEAVLHQRNIPLFAITATPFICENLHARRPNAELKDAAAYGAMVLMVTVSVLAVSGWYYVHFRYPYRFGIGGSPAVVPRDLADVLRKEQFTGNIYNTDSFGGYCLCNGFRPLLDGRYSDYDPAQFEMAAAAAHDAQLWESVVAAYRIQGVLLQHGGPEARSLIPQFRSGDRWKLVYYDHAISFWVKNEGRWLARPQADLSWESASSHLLPRIELLLNMVHFFDSMQQFDTGLRFVVEALKLKQWTPAVLEMKATLEIESGRRDAYEKTLSELLHRDPTNLFGLRQAALDAVYGGDFGKAKVFLERLREQDPENPKTIELYTTYMKWIESMQTGHP